MISIYLKTIILLCTAIDNGGKSELNIGYNRIKLRVFAWALYSLMSTDDYNNWERQIRLTLDDLMLHKNKKSQNAISSALLDIIDIIEGAKP